jgi:hypothetical protein
MSINPYQSPATDSAFPYGGSLDDGGLGCPPVVEGKCLVVASGTILPAVCVRTNQPVSKDDLLRKQFDWCTPWVALLVLVSALLVIIAYFVLRKRCWLTFGLHPELRKKYRRRMIFKVVVVLALIAAIVLFASMDAPVGVGITIILLVVAVIALFIGNSPLKVAKYRQGRFWIKGFSEEYLASMQQYSAGVHYPVPLA